MATFADVTRNRNIHDIWSVVRRFTRGKWTEATIPTMPEIIAMLSLTELTEVTIQPGAQSPYLLQTLDKEVKHAVLVYPKGPTDAVLLQNPAVNPRIAYNEETGALTFAFDALPGTLTLIINDMLANDEATTQATLLNSPLQIQGYNPETAYTQGDIALYDDGVRKTLIVSNAPTQGEFDPTKWSILVTKDEYQPALALITQNLQNEVTRAAAAEQVLRQDLASEIMRATAQENQIAQNLSAETARAGAAEQSLSQSLQQEITQRQAKDMASVQYNASTNSLQHNRTDGTAAVVAIPVADSNKNGLMSKQTYDQLQDIASIVSELIGKGTRRLTSAAINPEPEPTPDATWQASMNALWATASGGAAPVDGDTLISTNSATLWRLATYVASSNAWVYRGADTLSIASPTQLGIVLSTQAADNTMENGGSVFVEQGTGAMVVNGWDNMTGRITSMEAFMNRQAGFATATQAAANTQGIAEINSKIPAQATNQNQLADKDFVNSAIDAIAAFYITYNAQGDPFPTKAALNSVTVFYYAGQVRVPTKNDYCLVLADESKGMAVAGYASFTTTDQYIGHFIIYNNSRVEVTTANKDSVGITPGITIAYETLPTTRYVYLGDGGQGHWDFQVVVNETPFTLDQLAAINSGITSSLVQQIPNKLDKVNPTATGSFSLNRSANSVVGDKSSTFGNGNVASGSASHAEGYATEATGNSSHAEGSATQANGNNSHAEGFFTEANDECSHAEGYDSVANGAFSHAEGGSTANGYYSHAEGSGTVATHRSQHVFGELNIEDSNGASADNRGDYVEIVGNGQVVNNQLNRSNARTLKWNGDEWLAGNLTFATGKTAKVPTPTANEDAVPKSYVDNISTPLGGIILWPGSSGVVPANFLLCNGSEISRTTYAGLFSIIGTAFGAGDGLTTFNVPDMRNRFPVGAGNSYSRGTLGGSKDAVVVRHDHFIRNNANGGRVGIGNGNPGFNRINNFTLDTDVGQEIIAAPTGESGTDKNMPPYLALYYIIRAK